MYNEVKKVYPITTIIRTSMKDTPPTIGAPAPIPKKKNYLNNKDLLAEVRISKEQGRMSNNLALMLTMLCNRFGKRANFINYSYLDDMKSYAMMMLVKSWMGCKTDLGSNAFSYYTECIKNSFRQYLNVETRHSKGKNLLLIEHEMSPSHSFMTDYENEQRLNREEKYSSDDISYVEQKIEEHNEQEHQE